MNQQASTVNNPMRIGFIVYGSLQTCTGGYIYDSHLVRCLQENGHEVGLISLKCSNLLLKAGHNISPGLVKTICNFRPHILLQDALCLLSLPGFNRLLSRIYPVPKLALVHQLIFLRQETKTRRLYWQGMEKLFFRSVNGLVCNSNTTKQGIRKRLNINKPTLVANPGKDRLGFLGEKEIVERCSHLGPLKLFFLGNVVPGKGLDKLLQVLKHTREDIWRLTVAGDLDVDKRYSRTILNMIDQSNLAEKVNLLGQLEIQDLQCELRKQDVLCLPFSCEGFGIAFLEGMSHGLPVLGSSKGAAREIVTHGQNGFLVDPDRRGELQYYLELLYSDRERLQNMSLAALRSTQDFPGWRESMQNIKMFSEQFAAGNNAVC